MTGDEINQTFDELGNILVEVGLGWLRDAVGADINDGVLEVVTESALLEGAERGTRGKELRRTREEFLRPREYTPQEKLVGLIEAIEETVIQASDIEVRLGNDFVPRGNLRAVAFLDDRTSESLALDLRAAMVRHEAVGRLRALLAELRKEIES
jgi:hypothetical protein